MAAQKGRALLLKRGDGASPEVFTTIAGLTTKGIAGANGTLDVTTDDDDGEKRLLAGKYGLGYTISASGIAKDDATFDAIRTAFIAGTVSNYQVVVPGSTANGTWLGSFAITAFEETGETDGALSFNITLESAGDVTFT